jgi:non-homologous end joining protein Ku
MDCNGELVSPIVTNSKKSPFKGACPKCAESQTASGVKQFYACEHSTDHTGYTTGQLAKQTTSGVLVDKTAVDEANVSELPKNILEVEVYRRADVESRTLAAGQSYVFRPGRGKLYQILKHLLRSRPDLTFLGQVNLRDTEKLMMLTIGFGDQLLITELAWPTELREFPTEDTPDVKATLIDAAEKIVDSLTSDFDPQRHVKGTKERLTDLVARANAGEVVAPTGAPVTAVLPDTSDDDLAALLLASLEGAA